MQQTQQLISPAEYAKSRGLNRSTISRQIAAGVIPTHSGKVDTAEADAARAANIDPARRRARQPSATAEASYLQERTRREAAMASMQELTLAKMRGELVSIADVYAVWASIIIAIKNGFLYLPAKVAPRIEHMDAFEIEVSLKAAINEVLSDLSRNPLGVDEKKGEAE